MFKNRYLNIVAISSIGLVTGGLLFVLKRKYVNVIDRIRKMIGIQTIEEVQAIPLPITNYNEIHKSHQNETTHHIPLHYEALISESLQSLKDTETLTLPKQENFFEEVDMVLPSDKKTAQFDATPTANFLISKNLATPKVVLPKNSGRSKNYLTMTDLKKRDEQLNKTESSRSEQLELVGRFSDIEGMYLSDALKTVIEKGFKLKINSINNVNVDSSQPPAKTLCVEVYDSDNKNNVCYYYNPGITNQLPEVWVDDFPNAIVGAIVIEK